MMLHEIVAPRWCRLTLDVGVLAGALLAPGRDAHACGATPVEVQALLPLDRAVNVPVNAVLISSSNLTEAVFELHQVLDDADDADPRSLAEPDGDAGVNPPSDAGALGAVPLGVDCDARGQEGGAVCLARPLEPLKPNTRYAWRTNVVVPSGYIPEYFEGLSREFTTGSANDDEPIAADALRLNVTEDFQNPSTDGNGCGVFHWKTVAYSLRASEPAVLHFADYTPTYIMHATVLAGGGEATPAALYSPPDCLAPVLYDVAGHRTAVPEWCPTPVASPPAEVDEDTHGDPSRPPASSVSPNPSDSNAPTVAAPRARTLCTLSMPPTSTPRGLPTAAGLGFALLLTQTRRRRP
jgi:hypothetical protein